jgi:peptidyl-prolyl cis-trans isomerase D
MLRKMREDFKKYSWTLWLVIIAFIIGFSLTDIFNRNQLEESELLIIDGTVIKGMAFQKQLMQQIEGYRRQSKGEINYALLNQMGIAERLLQTLIDSTILEHQADKMKIRSTDDEVGDRIVNNPNFQRDGKFIGSEELKALLGMYHTTTDEYWGYVKSEINRSKLMKLVTAGLVIQENELKDMFKREKDKAELEYILLKPERIKSKITPSETELKAHYEKNKESYKTPEKRSGRVVSYLYDDFKKEIKMDEMELFDYFEKNKESFKTPGKTRVSRIFLPYEKETRDDVLKQAEALIKKLTPENFADQAKKISRGAKASEGGDWGYFDWKQLTSQEKSIIESLKDMEISTPVDTLEGFAVFFVAEKILEKGAVYTDDVKERIRNILLQGKLKNHVQTKLSKVYAKLKGEGDLKDKAEQMGLKVTSFNSLASGDPIKGVDELGYISRQLFGMKEKEIQFPVEFIKGVAIVQLTQITEPQLQNFEAARKEVTEEVIAKKKLEALDKEADKMADRLRRQKDKKQLDAFLKKEDLTLESLTYKRGNKFSNFPPKKGLDDQIFALREDQFSTPINLESGVVIVRLKNKTITGLIEFESEKKQYYQAKLDQLKNQYFSSYLYNLKLAYDQQQKIRYNHQLFTKIKEKLLPNK